MQSRHAPETPVSAPQHAQNDGPAESLVDLLLEIYEQERGELPPAGEWTAERRRRCALWLEAGFTPAEFRAAVRCAAATPFLAGDNERGWRASFDWLVANGRNARKVLAGEYAPRGRGRPAPSRAERRGLADLYTGIGPRPADCGVRVNPAVLERIRAREAGAKELPQAHSRRPQRAPEMTPKPVACDAQPRASPAALES